jgi:hypothetical protein
MPEQQIESELERAEEARIRLARDVKDLVGTARDKSRIVCYVGLGLAAVAVVTVLASGTKVLLRQSPRKSEDTRPLWIVLGRRMLVGAAGPLGAHLTRRWLLAGTVTPPAPDSSVDASEPRASA